MFSSTWRPVRSRTRRSVTAPHCWARISRPRGAELGEPLIVVEVVVGVGGDQDQIHVAAEARSSTGVGADKDQPNDVGPPGRPGGDGEQQRGDLTATAFEPGAHAAALRTGAGRSMVIPGSIIRRRR